jgi:hypothetical protein
MVTSFSFIRFACHPTKRKPQDNSSTLKTFATLSLLFLESWRQYFPTLKHKPSTTQKNKNNDFLLPWNASIGPSPLPSRDFDSFCWASHHINIASQQWPFQAFRWPKKITKSSHSLWLLQIVTAAVSLARNAVVKPITNLPCLLPCLFPVFMQEIPATLVHACPKK